ncbi:hypothetical protein IFM89_038418 [Coptis chinensis]|uniref:Transposase n=1 Tax=Coptis chinensis TaxID=261450 RepID=A0A835LH21_9MAGN|nr:hypothetical protein IFM89_038418 [Coptis chinensis]
MGKSRLYRNGVHGNEEEENKKKMKKGKNIDDRVPEPLSSKGKKCEKKGVACLGSHNILSQPNEAEAESASKRVKKERDAILAALFGHSDGGVHISNPRNDVFTSDQNIRPTERISNHRLNDETHQGDSFESGLNPFTEGLIKNSTKRGPAVCNVIPTEKSKWLKVTYNERGQPIHEESKKLVSFLGAQQKYVVPESARHITMRELGYLWRSSKSRFSRIIALCANEEEIMEKKPKNIKLEWWKSFVRKRLSKEFQKEESSNPSSVLRADVWKKVHTKKNGEPANDAVAAKVPYFEGIECKLFKMNKEDIVAEGTWLTDDPNAICGGVKLGLGACKVWVTNALEPSAKVWKPSNGLQTMEQAMTRSIAWPINHIIKMVIIFILLLQVELRDIDSGNKVTERFRADEALES